MTSLGALPLSTKENMLLLSAEWGNAGLMGRSIAKLEARMAPHLLAPIDVR